MKKYSSFRFKILGVLLPPIIVGMLFILFVAYHYTNEIINTEYSNQLLKTTTEASQNINTWLKGRLLEVETIANTPDALSINDSFTTTDQMNIERFRYLTSNYPDEFADIYSANANYEYHTIKQDNNSISIFVGSLKNRDYYESIMAGGDAQMTAPLISRTTGKATVFMVAPIRDSSGKTHGLIGAGILLNYVQDRVEQLKIGETGYGIAIANDGLYIKSGEKSKDLSKKITEEEEESVKALGKKMLEEESGIFRYTFEGTKKVAFFSKIPVNGWSIATVIDEKELLKPISVMLTRIAFAIAAITVIVVFLVIFVSSRLLAPVNLFRQYADGLATGDMTHSLKIDRNDEFGILSNHFNRFGEKLRESVQHVTEISHQLASSSDEMSSASLSFADSSQKQLTYSNDISDSVEQVAEGINSISEMTAEQMTELEELIDRVNHLSLVIDDMNNRVTSSRDMTVVLEKKVLDGEQSLKEMNSSMSLIIESSKEISNIILIINEISEQINLLSLNASIEAARAGNAGLGFAVVADEISKLAEETAHSIQNIDFHIQKNNDEIVEGMSDVVNSIEQMNSVIEGFSTITELINTFEQGINKQILVRTEVRKSTDLVIEKSKLINEWSERQSKAADHISVSIKDINTINQSIATGSEEMAANAEEVSAMSGKLVDAIGFFKF